MTTPKQLERLWEGRQFNRLAAELLSARPEATVLPPMGQRPGLVAALALIRLDEINCTHVPFYSRLIRSLLAAQESDGSFGDPLATALALRALTTDAGSGPAVDRAVASLASAQKDDGSWAAEPLRRMPSDAGVTVAIVALLAGVEAFRVGVRFDSAVRWVDRNVHTADPSALKVWEAAGPRCRRLAASPTCRPAATRLADQLSLWS